MFLEKDQFLHACLLQVAHSGAVNFREFGENQWRDAPQRDPKGRPEQFSSPCHWESTGFPQGSRGKMFCDVAGCQVPSPRPHFKTSHALGRQAVPHPDLPLSRDRSSEGTSLLGLPENGGSRRFKDWWTRADNSYELSLPLCSISLEPWTLPWGAGDLVEALFQGLP